MAVETGAVQDVIHAPVDKIVDALLDFESHPDWQGHIRSSRVLERDGEGRGVLVEEEIDAKVRRVRIVCRYTYDLPHRLEWHQVEGDLRSISCAYTFTPRPDGTTLVAVDLRFEVGFFVPGPVKKVIRDQALRTSLRELRGRVEG